MLYAIAHFLRDKVTWLWNLVDVVNSALFQLRYGKRLSEIKFQSVPNGFKVLPLSNVQTETVVQFFAQQPEEAYTFFHPHGFDAKAIKRLQRNKAFLAYLLIDESTGNVAGYCFIRSFFHGKGFRGRLVDINYRGKGLATMMNKMLNEVGFGIGLRLFETVSKDNIASFRSLQSSSDYRIIEERPNKELYVEIIKN